MFLHWFSYLLAPKPRKWTPLLCFFYCKKTLVSFFVNIPKVWPQFDHVMVQFCHLEGDTLKKTDFNLSKRIQQINFALVIVFYIISPVMHTFWLVLTYYLLEDRRIDDDSACVPLFCSYHILTSSVIYYWTDARKHGIYLLIIQQEGTAKWAQFEPTSPTKKLTTLKKRRSRCIDFVSIFHWFFFSDRLFWPNVSSIN